MTFTYDPKLNIAYIQLGDDSGHVTDSHVINDDIVVDIGADGEVFGIELLNASEQLRKSNGKFQFINSLTKERREMPLPVF